MGQAVLWGCGMRCGAGGRDVGLWDEMWGRRCCGAVGHNVGQVVLWVEMWGRRCCGAVGPNVGQAVLWGRGCDVGQAVLWGCGSRCGAGGAVGLWDTMWGSGT